MSGILIIDDEIELLEKIAFILEDYVDDIYTAESAEKAMELMENHDDICCVVADVNMPDKDGIEILRDARQKKISIPFIFYSGKGDDDSMLESSKHGTYDFIMKPNFSQLEKSVQEAVALGKRILSGEQIDLQLESNKTYRDLVQALKP